MTRALFPLFLLILSLSLSACSWLDTSESKQKVKCNQLKSYIVFNGGTSNIRRAEIQRAEKPLAQYNYDTQCTN